VPTACSAGVHCSMIGPACRSSSGTLVSSVGAAGLPRRHAEAFGAFFSAAWTALGSAVRRARACPLTASCAGARACICAGVSAACPRAQRVRRVLRRAGCRSTALTGHRPQAVRRIDRTAGFLAVRRAPQPRVMLSCCLPRATRPAADVNLESVCGRPAHAQDGSMNCTPRCECDAPPGARGNFGLPCVTALYRCAARDSAHRL
jgi:hypothetical protein